MPESPQKVAPKWHHPSEVMKLHKLKMKKKALQARISGGVPKDKATTSSSSITTFEDILTSKKRTNPFLANNKDKKSKREPPAILDESTDQTLFKLLHQNDPTSAPINNAVTSFKDILTKTQDEEVVIVKAQGEPHLPVDWTLKRKARLWSSQPFSWNQRLKICEEASGTTSFVRCLDTTSCNNNLDTSPNAKFHQCCLYWQQPSLPWLSVFPRATGKISESGASFATNLDIKRSLQTAWSDSLRSLFQLVRTKQCPYFYACGNSFTVLFRAAGVCGFSDVHAVITPTTRGFRHLLRQEEIEFTMPLKKKRVSDQGYETLDSAVSEQAEAEEEEEEEEVPDEEWLKSMGLNAQDIKQINYTQDKITHKAECEVDNSEQSLVLVVGVEVHALYNFLINCKSATASTGPLAGIPPTLLAPVAFNGATLNALKVRESKVHVDNKPYYSLELTGPILPSTVHSLFSINPPEQSMSSTFTDVAFTSSFSKVTRENSQGFAEAKGNVIFDKENLTDCGLSSKILEQFCTPDRVITNVECLKYNSDSKTYTWT